MMEGVLKRGTLVTVVTAMILLLGVIAAMRVPVQMIPDLDTRVITIDTRWPGATPQDVEKEIIIEQEEYLRDLIVVRRGDSITRLRDVAEVNFDHFEIRSRTFTNGGPNIRLSLIRNTGSNVMEIKRAVLPVVEQMNRDILRPAGLQMLLSNDDVRYVEDSVGNVWSNIFIGAALAAAVLYCYLRSAPATLIGMCGMPVFSGTMTTVLVFLPPNTFPRARRPRPSPP